VLCRYNVQVAAVNVCPSQTEYCMYRDNEIYQTESIQSCSYYLHFCNWCMVKLPRREANKRAFIHVCVGIVMVF
jgi:hypothetical protein